MSYIHSRISSYACAETILPSWFVGLLVKPALLSLHQHRVSQGRPPCTGVLSRHECRCCRMRWCPACTRNRAGLVSPRRRECDVLHPHVMEGFFCSRAFPLTCCCSHRRGEMCVRERVERVSEQMALIGRGMDFPPPPSSASIKKVMRRKPYVRTLISFQRACES